MKLEDMIKKFKDKKLEEMTPIEYSYLYLYKEQLVYKKFMQGKGREMLKEFYDMEKRYISLFWDKYKL